MSKNDSKSALRNTIRTSSVGVLVAALLGIGTVPAAAATLKLEGGLSCIGNLTQYKTFRMHERGGSSLKVTSFTSVASGGVNYGLRNSNDRQITQSVNFKKGSLNTKKSFKTTAGSTTIPRGRLAVNARHITKSTGCGWPTPSWKGTLVL